MDGAQIDHLVVGEDQAKILQLFHSTWEENFAVIYVSLM